MLDVVKVDVVKDVYLMLHDFLIDVESSLIWPSTLHAVQSYIE